MRRVLLSGGIAGPVLFTLVWLVEQSVRPGYQPSRHWISLLSLTDAGWIQIAAFLVSGTLIAAFGRGLRAAFPDGPGSVWGPRLVTASGVALVAGGVFTIDPGLGYPPGTEAAITWHGVLHNIAGPVCFFAIAAAAIVYARRFARPFALTCGITTLVGWAAAGVLAGLDYAGTWRPAPAGLAERVSLVAGFAWTVYLAVKARAQVPAVTR
ncbi:DUF998 domain-containing protein [Actinocrispum wychmicini]|uniref:Putative membrane protein n=1 Tax=Actinocrispum wychmicini TaxID=1213861 RepID=A0A4R2JUA7_9PSEU|nr:DUF998 domain-containing protein [Actinocrispum wychmicini]TCO60888.1 putative membrane protein [Actinocrispum wychmicini]